MQGPVPTPEDVARTLARLGIAASAREAASVAKALARLAPEPQA
ncbi:hypothetical protein [Bordetella genomosp. 12]|nr:hypothetical protein [Bordetella genomosp. 12]